MRSTTLTWLLLLTLGLGSSSISWVRIDGLGNGWIGIQLARGDEVRVEFVDLDGSGDLTAADLRGTPRQQLDSQRAAPRRSIGRQQTILRLGGNRSQLQDLGN